MRLQNSKPLASLLFVIGNSDRWFQQVSIKVVILGTIPEMLQVGATNKQKFQEWCPKSRIH